MLEIMLDLDRDMLDFLNMLEISGYQYLQGFSVESSLNWAQLVCSFKATYMLENMLEISGYMYLQH